MEKSSLILFEALDFGLHVLEAGLFRGEDGFFGLRLAYRDFGLVGSHHFRLWGRWFGRQNGFDWAVFLREAQGL